MQQTIEIIHTNSNSLSIIGLERLLTEYNTGFQVHSVSSFVELAEVELSGFQGVLVIGVNSLDEDYVYQEVESLKMQFSCIKILLIVNKITENLVRLRGIGVQGCISSCCSTEEIIEAIQTLEGGKHFYCQGAVPFMYGDAMVSNMLTIDCQDSTLSKREIEITNHIGEGLTNREIALTLNLSIHTVHTHRKNIMRKMNVKTASELIKQAIYLEIIK